MSEKKGISRRNFLKIAGISTAAVVVVCGGGGYLASQPPAINFVEEEIKKDNPMNKILIAYASKAGSTGEVAQTMAEALASKNVSVDVKQIKHVTDINEYSGVIVGSAIRMGRWLSEAVNFVKDNQSLLSQKPNAFFLVSGTLKEDTPENQAEVKAYLDPVLKIMEPGSVGLFAGKIDFSKLSFIDRFIMEKMIKATEGDWRDWDAIRTWATQALPIT